VVARTIVPLFLSGLRDRAAADPGGGRGLAGNGFPAVGHDSGHFQVHAEPEQQGREPDDGRRQTATVGRAEGTGQPARAAVVRQSGVALPEHQLLRVALFPEDGAAATAAAAVINGGRRPDDELQRDPTESENARRLGHAGRQADRARPAVLAGRVPAGVRLRARVPARVPAAVPRAAQAAARPARHPGQGGQAGRPAAHAVVPGRARAAAQGLHQPGHVRARGAPVVAADAPARPVGRRPVREPGVPDERRRAAAVHAVALRGRQPTVHHERGEYRSGE